MRKGGIVKTRQIKIEYKRQLALAKFPFAPRGRWRDSTPSTVNTQYTRNTTQDSQKRESKGVLNKYFLVSDHTERRNHHTSGQTDWPVTRVPSVAQVAKVSLKKKKKKSAATSRDQFWGSSTKCAFLCPRQWKRKCCICILLSRIAQRRLIPSVYLQPAGWHKRDIYEASGLMNAPVFWCPSHQWLSQFGSYSAHFTTLQFTATISPLSQSERNRTPSE